MCGRRLVITSALFGLTTVGSTGVALAASDTIGHSPSAKVVAHAPMAVSVTFREPLRRGGARIRILTEDGDIGTGPVSTDRKTLKRELRLGAPGGEYTVVWSAISAKGQRISGQFSFRAARTNGEVERTSPVPSPPVTSPLVEASDPRAITDVVESTEPTRTVEPTGFTAVPLTVGGLLVLAAGLVSLINRHRS